VSVHLGRLLPTVPIWLLLLTGCLVEKPESPTFDTDLYIPLGSQKTTGLDLYQDSEYIGGDSTGADPLAFILRGDVPEIQVGSALDEQTTIAAFQAGLGQIAIDPSDPVNMEFEVPSLVGAPPVDPEGEVVAPFEFTGPSRIAPPSQTFQWIRLDTGTLHLRFSNNFDLPLGAPGDTALSAVLRDRVDHTEVGQVFALGVIAARGTANLLLDLAGRSFHDGLEVEVRGMSPGSQGRLVPIEATDGIGVGFSIDQLMADSCLAVVPAQTIRIDDKVPMEEDRHLEQALILDGALTLVVRNSIPVAATMTVRFPDLARGGQPFPPVLVELPSGGNRPAEVRTRVELSGAALWSAPAPFLTSLRYSVIVQSRPGQSVVSLGTHQTVGGVFEPGTIRFAEVTGTFDQRRIDVEPIETDVNPPEGIDELDFQNASLTLELENTAGLDAEARLLVQGIPVDASPPVSLPLQLLVPGSAAPGVPGRATITVDQTNSAILDLIAARPRKLIVSGEVRVGGNETAGAVHRTDGVHGHYQITAPLRVRLGEIEHRTDPFSFTLNDDDQDRIRQNLVSGTATGEVENHFPAGLTARLVFAEREEDLETHPSVVLDSISVLPAEVDGEGRVIRSTRSAFQIEIRPDDVQFFARDKVVGQIRIMVHGPGDQALVMITALDYVDVRGLLHLRTRIHS
jgi:hypothetical protein